MTVTGRCLPVREYIRADLSRQEALSRTTHLAIGAHQDDVEIMAQYGVLECFNDELELFSAAILTDGAGSRREGSLAALTERELVELRNAEQIEAARIGRYGFVRFLHYPSAVVRQKSNAHIVSDLKQLFLEVQPRIIYLHNPADRHPTHVATTMRSIEALQQIAKQWRPDKVYGCEVWGGLDWLPNGSVAVLELPDRLEISQATLAAFQSQTSGGKRYDLAAIGRLQANATFRSTSEKDGGKAASYVMNLTPLLDGGDPVEYIKTILKRFSNEVIKRICQFSR